MPEYSYHCSVCDETHGVVHPMSEVGQEQHCPDCGAVMKRKFAPTPRRWVHPHEKLMGKHVDEVIPR